MSCKDVAFYWNFHKKTFSIVDVSTGRVCSYSDTVYLKDAVFKVSQSGRKRVLKEKRKNVHARVYGKILKRCPSSIEFDNQVLYNPYKHCGFTMASNGDTVSDAPFVKLSRLFDKGIFKGAVWI